MAGSVIGLAKVIFYEKPVNWYYVIPVVILDLFFIVVLIRRVKNAKP